MGSAIIVSKQDQAGLNIASFLEGKLPANLRLHFIDGNQCYADSVDEIRADAFVFASKHRSESGKPTLTVHAPGNWGKAELGGKDRTLVPTSAVLNKTLIVNLEKEARASGVEWPVVAEVDHHGPYLTKPTVFVEIGSTETEWQNKAAAKAVANAILVSANIGAKYSIAAGVGGPHYCPLFSKVLLKTNIALGHIAPKHALDNFDPWLFKQMIDKTVEPVEFVLIDWKGTSGPQRKKIIDYCNGTGLRYKRVKEVL